MTKLSPAAQAVWAVYLDHSDMDETPADLPALAAALRAVAGIIKRSEANSTTSTDWGDGWKNGVRETAQGLLAIAAELESSHD